MSSSQILQLYSSGARLETSWVVIREVLCQLKDHGQINSRRAKPYLTSPHVMQLLSGLIFAFSSWKQSIALSFYPVQTNLYLDPSFLLVSMRNINIQCALGCSVQLGGPKQINLPFLYSEKNQQNVQCHRVHERRI